MIYFLILRQPRTKPLKFRHYLTILSIYSFLNFSISYAQNTYDKKYYEIQKSQEYPNIDGNWNDAVWQNIPITTDFIQIEPLENAPPSFKTEVKMFYSNDALFIAAYCYDDEPNEILKQLGNRDDELNADHFRIAIDPYDNQQDFTSFQVTASGVQSDWKNSDGNFNAVWESAVTIKENGWMVEIKIPYSALRFSKNDEQQWAIQMYRSIQRFKEEVIWSPTKLSDNSFMNYFGKLTGISNIDPPLRLSLTPFIGILLQSAPNENNEKAFDYLVSGGADLKYGITASFTLDATLLPDFSQVQSDDFINNLTAFEQTFDEQRSFFQEGVDLFNKADLFYSRRIGAGVRYPSAGYDAENDSTELISNPTQSRLLNALKISGRTKKNIGIGIFNAIEARSYAKLKTNDGEIFKIQNDPLSNYNIVVMDKIFPKNRNIYAINTNVTRSDGARNGNVSAIGFSANFKNDMYNFRGSTSYSIINDKVDSLKLKRGFQYILDFDKLSGNFRYGWRTEAVSENYDKNDLGVIFQRNFYQHGWSMNYILFEPHGKIRDLFTQLFMSVRQHMPTGELSAVFLNLQANTTFDKQFLSFFTEMQASLYEEKDFYAARTEGQVYRRPRFANFNAGISTDYRKKLALDTEMNVSFSAANGGAYEVYYSLSPIYRINDHLTLRYNFEVFKSIDDVGYADRNSEGIPIFGKRDIIDYTNVLSGKYIFKNNLSLDLRARHYWSRVDYQKFYELDDEGYLTSTLYNYEVAKDDNNINFNVFNIDVLFNWEFAPGSALSISYKNDIASFNSNTQENIFQNLGNLFDEVQTNSVSIKLLYYIDYVTVRSWVNRRKSKNS